MFVLAGQIKVDPEHHDAAAAAMLVMQEATSHEEGNSAYVFTAELAERGTFRIFELWETDEALAAHFTAEHMKIFQAALKACGPRRADVPFMRYDVSQASPFRP